ncbi:virion protein [Pseudoalteromonas sp. Scap03]|uniref:virion protein n=1 Tax=unclassified Pseudoalteromonas TaxID=194690 RepID=UPI0015BB69CE|nr:MULTISPECIES: virion protein [unclassified Pseudoalteromonas]NWL16318.1 virion protein [Pseudoalteromonas sp. Scap03]QLE81436.1 virion protein [Pseudoalteromonas sp. Scap25]QLE89380.1 virion protein [Pseudoalteromonas sp. Scap06]
MKKSTVLLSMAGLAALAGVTSSSGTPRGIRNHNPLNIEARESWVGQVGDDGRFIIFETPLHGFRAAGRIMRSKAKRGVRTIESIINEWAPDNENHTQNYINFVSDKAGYPADMVLNDAAYPAVLSAMVTMENGQNPYTMDEIKRGFEWGYYG